MAGCPHRAQSLLSRVTPNNFPTTVSGAVWCDPGLMRPQNPSKARKARPGSLVWLWLLAPCLRRLFTAFTRRSSFSWSHIRVVISLCHWPPVSYDQSSGSSPDPTPPQREGTFLPCVILQPSPMCISLKKNFIEI